jgi:hypothetical protein
LGRFLRLNIGSKYCCCYLHDKNRRDSFFFWKILSLIDISLDKYFDFSIRVW